MAPHHGGWDDADLVGAARGGDKDAFAILIIRHRPMVLTLIRRLLWDSVMCLDVAQEATLAAMVGLDRLQSPERFGAWYAGIALNMARKYLRAQTRVTPLAIDIAEAGLGPEERAEAAELSQRIRQAVKGLATGQREAILAYYWQGLTHAEAASELGVSPGAVKARLHQARATLAVRIASYVRPEEEVRPVPTTDESTWVEVDVAEVRRSSGPDVTNQVHAVILQERGGPRRLPIYVGAPEAVALACSLEAIDMPRPMTYQLAANLIGAAGSTLTGVRITRLAESTFYAVALLAGPAGPAEVDARPSDALNLALVCGAPIRVDASVLDDPEALRFAAWEDFPTRTPELVAEVQERQGRTVRAMLSAAAKTEADQQS